MVCTLYTFKIEVQHTHIYLNMYIRKYYRKLREAKPSSIFIHNVHIQINSMLNYAIYVA